MLGNSFSVFTYRFARDCQTERMMVEQCSVPVAFHFTASGATFAERYKMHFDFLGTHI